MTQRQWNTPVVVLADDLTGANDVAAGLAGAGARVCVLFNAEGKHDSARADVWVINTDSRALSAEEAAKRTQLAVDSLLLTGGNPWIFKKIDSTLRGNVGAEIEAALLASGAGVALIVPAVPRLGRVTRCGNTYIHGALLTESEFATDPKTPINSANIAARIAQQSALPSREITPGEADSLAVEMQAAIEQGVRYLIMDAESEEDLRNIMQAAAMLPSRPLLAGAAGLSEALCALLRGKAAQPLLAVVGSMSEIAQRQLDRLQAWHPVDVVEIDVAQLFASPVWADRALWKQAALDALRAGKHCVIRTCSEASQRHHIAQLCEEYQYDRRQLGEQICLLLADLTREIIEQVNPAALYLSGGDVAMAVAQGLGATGFEIHGQIAGCVPYGRLLDVKHALLVMTKAGGFGDENTLIEVIRFIEEKSSE